MFERTLKDKGWLLICFILYLIMVELFKYKFYLTILGFFIATIFIELIENRRKRDKNE